MKMAMRVTIFEEENTHDGQANSVLLSTIAQHTRFLGQTP